MTEAEVQAMIAEADEDGDKKLNYVEVGEIRRDNNNLLGPSKKLFGCPPPPTPSFWKLEKSFHRTKVYHTLFSEFNFFFFLFLFRILIFWKYFLSCCCQLFLHFQTGLKLVWRDFIGEVDLFTHLFVDKVVIILCSIDFDLTKNL